MLLRGVKSVQGHLNGTLETKYIWTNLGNLEERRMGVDTHTSYWLYLKNTTRDNLLYWKTIASNHYIFIQKKTN